MVPAGVVLLPRPVAAAPAGPWACPRHGFATNARDALAALPPPARHTSGFDQPAYNAVAGVMRWDIPLMMFLLPQVRQAGMARAGARARDASSYADAFHLPPAPLHPIPPPTPTPESTGAQAGPEGYTQKQGVGFVAQGVMPWAAVAQAGGTHPRPEAVPAIHRGAQCM